MGLEKVLTVGDIEMIVTPENLNRYFSRPMPFCA